MKIKLIISLLAVGLLIGNVIAQEENPTIRGYSKTMESQAKKNLLAGQAFLADNKEKPGVVTLRDGLQYKVITAGTGPMPNDGDNVTVHYEGKLIDGTVFDSSYKRGNPTSFPVSAVIPGWVEALKMMKVGSVWEIYIPPSLGYGEYGAPPAIGPNETLIFKVELLGIDKKQ